MEQAELHRLESPTPQRRSFLVKLAASVAGAVLMLFPFAAGWGVLFHPLRRRSGNAGGEQDGAEKLVRIGQLDILPADGLPHPFAVVADVADAWTREVGQRIGAVFLSRTDVNGKPLVTAFSATCPHLGCAIEFDAHLDRFECPCHESGFAKDGQRLFGPSPRGLDPLPVKLVEANGQLEIWVAYAKFRTGIPERKPIG